MPTELTLIPALAAPGTGQIHSIYRSTINFTLGGKLFSLQDWHAEYSPISFVAAQSALPPCRLKECVVWNGHVLQIGAFTYDARSAKRFTGELSVGYHLSLPKNACLPAPFFPFGGSYASHIEASEIMSRVSKILEARQWDSSAEVACEMLGLGCGLTPSGDDWLTGMLALLHFSAAAPISAMLLHALCSHLPAHLHETNDISARFLELACTGRFSAPICALFLAWNEKNAQQFDAAVKRILQLGHSSGADTLAGILFLYNHLKTQ